MLLVKRTGRQQRKHERVRQQRPKIQCRDWKDWMLLVQSRRSISFNRDIVFLAAFAGSCGVGEME